MKAETAEEWIETVKDPVIKGYLKDNVAKYPASELRREKYVSFGEFLSGEFWWIDTPQGLSFWSRIWSYSKKFELKYEDFKHLDGEITLINHNENRNR